MNPGNKKQNEGAIKNEHARDTRILGNKTQNELRGNQDTELRGNQE